MIYVENTSESVELHIPRNLSGVPAEVDLDITGTVSKASRNIAAELVSVSALYYVVSADFSHCPPGEYTYDLSDAETGETVSTGILQVAKPKKTVIQYRNKTVYEQYNP